MAQPTLPFGKDHDIEYLKDYHLTHGLLSPSEAKFYGSLLQASMNLMLMPFPKVRVEDIVYVNKYSHRRESLRGRVKSRHFDFILCSLNETLKPVLALELDGQTHLEEGSQISDRWKRLACTQVGLPLVRIHQDLAYDSYQIEHTISEALYAA